VKVITPFVARSFDWIQSRYRRNTDVSRLASERFDIGIEAVSGGANDLDHPQGVWAVLQFTPQAPDHHVDASVGRTWIARNSSTLARVDRGFSRKATSRQNSRLPKGTLIHDPLLSLPAGQQVRQTRTPHDVIEECVAGHRWRELFGLADDAGFRNRDI
jgi:hypothetical protein